MFSGCPRNGPNAVTLMLLFAICLLVGCSKKEAAANPAPSPAPAPAPPPAAAQNPSPAAPSLSPSAGLTTQGEFPGVTLAVQELKRGSNTVTLKFVVANQAKQGFPTYAYFYEKEGNSADGVHLIDPINKKKYFVVRDTDGACLCSRQIQGIAPGAQSVLWAKFPAPPDDVQRMTVEVPHFPPLEDVPVTR